MKNGFKEVVDKILRKYGLKTRDCVGTVWADGDINWKILQSMGYRVEQGISRPDYDYVILSKEKSTLNNILEALHKIKLGCIIIFRIDDNRKLAENLMSINQLRLGLNTYFYAYEGNKALGVTFKGKEF